MSISRTMPSRRLAVLSALAVAPSAAPVPVGTVGPYGSTFTDAVPPASPVIWYAVRETGPCAS